MSSPLDALTPMMLITDSYTYVCVCAKHQVIRYLLHRRALDSRNHARTIIPTRLEPVPERLEVERS